jgi:hypothetical protein
MRVVHDVLTYGEVFEICFEVLLQKFIPFEQKILQSPAMTLMAEVCK